MKKNNSLKRQEQWHAYTQLTLWDGGESYPKGIRNASWQRHVPLYPMTMDIETCWEIFG
jgi:hypothetical protein